MKKRRFDDGGEVTGRNENIDDAARMRAMEFVRRKQEERELADVDKYETTEPGGNEKTAPRSARSAPTRPNRTPDESPAEMQRLREQQGRAEIKRLESVDRPIERVAPELMLPPGRMLGAANMAARGLASRGAAQAAEPTAAAATQAANIARATAAERRAAAQKEYLERTLAARRMAKQKEAVVRGNREQLRRTPEETAIDDMIAEGGRFKRGGKVQKYAKGGSVSSGASRRADGIAQRGKTKGRMY